MLDEDEKWTRASTTVDLAHTTYPSQVIVYFRRGKEPQPELDKIFKAIQDGCGLAGVDKVAATLVVSGSEVGFRIMLKPI